MLGLRLYLILAVKDRSGKIRLVRRYVSRSFVQNFMNFLKGLMTAQQVNISTTLVSSPWSNAVNIATVNDENGNAQTLQTQRCGPAGQTVYLSFLGVNAPEGDDTWGIVVGNGTTAPAPSDYALESKIPNGTGDGQLSYSAVSIGDVVVNNNLMLFEISRNFTNNGGVTVTVSEAGLIARYAVGYYTVNQDIKFLIARDKLKTPIDVNPGETLIAKYRVKAQT